MLKRLRNRWNRRRAAAHYELVPEGWARAARDARVKGWDVAAVVDAQLKRLTAWRESLAGGNPLGMRDANRAYTQADLATHNTAVSFAYVCALAACGAKRLSLLDWGGGVGQYAFAAEAALPGISIDYHCKEVPAQCHHGQRVLPKATFYTADEQFAGRKFDLVFASGALHYERDWQALLGRLAAVTGGYLFVTRLPTVIERESFVYLQRAYEHGYDTEYLGWCLNRADILKTVESKGLKLVREFLVAESGHIPGVNEDYQSRGFLFQPAGCVSPPRVPNP